MIHVVIVYAILILGHTKLLWHLGLNSLCLLTDLFLCLGDQDFLDEYVHQIVQKKEDEDLLRLLYIWINCTDTLMLQFRNIIIYCHVFMQMNWNYMVKSLVNKWLSRHMDWNENITSFFFFSFVYSILICHGHVLD